MPGVFSFSIHLGDDFFPGHAGPPLLGRLERDDGFKHGERRGVGGRFGLAGLAENPVHFRNGSQQTVLDLQNACRFRYGHARHGGGHEKNRPLVERRHEFRAEFVERKIRRRPISPAQPGREPSKPQHETHDGLIDPNEKTVHRIFGFRRDFAADQQRHQHRHQRHAQQRGEEHRKCLGEGQRLEQPPFLRFQRKHRNETHRDDQQRKEQRPADALGGGDDDFNALGVGRLAAVFLAEMFQEFVRVLDHDDGRIHHRADGDGDAAQRHDVRGQVQSRTSAETKEGWRWAG